MLLCDLFSYLIVYSGHLSMLEHKIDFSVYTSQMLFGVFLPLGI